MPRMKPIWLALVLFAIAIPAHAQTSESPESPEFLDESGNAFLRVCSGVENAQLVKVVLKYIRDNPEDAHHSTRVLIIGALAKVYPCSARGAHDRQ
jgi:hypothetical protein